MKKIQHKVLFNEIPILFLLYVILVVFTVCMCQFVLPQIEREKENKNQIIYDKGYDKGYEKGFYDGYWKSQGEHGIY